MNIRISTTAANPSQLTVRHATSGACLDDAVGNLTIVSEVGLPPRAVLDVPVAAVEIDLIAEAQINPANPAVRLLLDALGLGSCESIDAARRLLAEHDVPLSL